MPPPEQLQPGNPVRRGWEAGRAAFGRRTLPAGRPVRQWLQLRLEAWLHSLVFDPAVNPALLRRIDAARCPVTGEPLGPGTGDGREAVVVRVNGDAGYAPGNLAVMGARAARAKTGRGPEAALALARRIDDGGPPTIDGLDARQWRRLAVLGSFATPLPHARAAALPMLVLPPSRLHLLNPVQGLQLMLSLQVTRAGHARRCAALGALMPSADARHAFHAFMHTLLARRLAAGRLDSFADERAAVERLWEDTLVDRRWQRLVRHLDAAACPRVVELALARGLAGSALHGLPPQRAAEGWALSSRGRLDEDAAGASAEAEPAAGAPARYPARPAVPARPAPEWRARPAPRPPTI